MIVYHGSDTIVENPDVIHSKKYLDFGKGFYVTTVREQAERLAKRKALISECKSGIINIFEFNINTDFKIKDFSDDLENWIDFVCRCRDGSDENKKYDIVIGKVADDKVFRVVDMYKRGIWDKKRAIEEMKIYRIYNQIAFISQNSIDSMLIFKESIEVSI